MLFLLYESNSLTLPILHRRTAQQKWQPLSTNQIQARNRIRTSTRTLQQRKMLSFSLLSSLGWLTLSHVAFVRPYRNAASTVLAIRDDAEYSFVAASFHLASEVDYMYIDCYSSDLTSVFLALIFVMSCKSNSI